MISKMERYEVSIAGETFSIMSDEGESSVKTLAKTVDSLIQDISKKSGSSDIKRVAILAAFEFAHKLKEMELTSIEKDEKESKLAKIIDQELLSITP